MFKRLHLVLCPCLSNSVLLALLHAEIVLERFYALHEICDFIRRPGLQMRWLQLFYALSEGFKMCVHCLLPLEA